MGFISRSHDMSFLRSHPFPVLARLERVIAVSFAFPREVLQPLVPKGLEMDCHEGFGFVTVAMVWTRALRPAGFPECLGQDFFLAGYRIFARLRDPSSGRNLRGLKILRSETDQQPMVVLGNLMTGYAYRRVNVSIHADGDETRIETSRDGATTLDLTLHDSGEHAALPEGSPFVDWRTARRFAGPMPFTFSPAADGSFIVIEGSRADWVPRPVSVKYWKVAMFDEAPFRDVKPILANAFTVENIPYRWNRGRIILPEATS